jgi:hypothetical protein
VQVSALIDSSSLYLFGRHVAGFTLVAPQSGALQLLRLLLRRTGTTDHQELALESAMNDSGSNRNALNRSLQAQHSITQRRGCATYRHATQLLRSSTRLSPCDNGHVDCIGNAR